LAASTEVRFHASDGVRLEGRLFGRGRTGVVLAHMSDGSQGEWFSFAAALAERGIGSSPTTAAPAAREATRVARRAPTKFDGWRDLVALLGLIGGPGVIASGIAVLFDVIEPGSAAQFIATIPEMFWEL
jgi:hypothetical protein